MAFNISWDESTKRLYETGVDRGVLYPMGANGYESGVAWNGLTSVSENPEGGEPTDIWADNIKYLSLMSAENYKATIEAYTYPDAFMECDGSKEILNSNESTGMYVTQQTRKKFGFCYRTKIGNDTDGDDHGYKIHIVYGASASPSDKSYTTINDSPEAITFSWDISCVPDNTTAITDGVTIKPTACVIVDSTKADTTNLTKLEEYLYGKDGTNSTAPALPSPAQVYSLLTTGLVS